MESVFGRSMESWISVQSVTWSSVQLRYGLPGFFKEITANLLRGGSEIQRVVADGNNAAGQLRFEGLEPDTEYAYEVRAGGECFSETFRTLPKPLGRCLFRMAVLADPHLSCCGMDVMGRLHAESGDILRLFLRVIRERGSDLVICLGDVTDEGWPREYALASRILADFPLPFYATPGNHDIENDVEHIFQRQFGTGVWLRHHKGFQLAALDTSDGKLDKPANMEVVSALKPDEPLVLFTHYQLFADAWIPDANRVIEDGGAPHCAAMLEKLSACRGILYAGHKNVASQVVVNRLVQLNTPQPTHFPAGYLEADFYEDGVWHQFVPLPSEVQNEYSRLGTEHSRPHSRPGCSCRSEYRDHYTKELWNQVVRL